MFPNLEEGFAVQDPLPKMQHIPVVWLRYTSVQGANSNRLPVLKSELFKINAMVLHWYSIKLYLLIL